MSNHIASRATEALRRFGVIARKNHEPLRPSSVPQERFGVANLPDEVCLQIFELLRLDRETLLACCLTCRYWAAIIATSYFHAIDLSRDVDLPILRELLARRLSCHIRDLTIRIDIDHVFAFKVTVHPLSRRRQISLMVAVALPNDQGRATVLDCGARLSSVQTLTLNHTRVVDIENLVGLLSAFPELRECTVDLARVSKCAVGSQPSRSSDVSLLFVEGRYLCSSRLMLYHSGALLSSRPYLSASRMPAVSGSSITSGPVWYK